MIVGRLTKEVNGASIRFCTKYFVSVVVNKLSISDGNGYVII